MFAKKKLQIFCKQPVKGNLHILVFFNYTSGYLKFCNFFCIFEMAWSRAFQKCIIYHFLDNFFLQTFLLYNWFLQILKVEHKSFPMMYHLSNLDIRNGT